MISAYQLFSLIVLYQFGTTVIFGFASDAGRDAWVAAALSSLLGAGLICGYALLTKLNGHSSLVSWFTRNFGIWAGTPIAWLYPLLFLYDGARVICDLKFLLPLTLLPATPPWFFLLAFMLVVIYLLDAGAQVLFRMAGILLPVLLVFILLEALLLWVSGSLHLSYVRPVLGQGFGKVLSSVWPLGITQTYGETIEIAVLWHLMKKESRLGLISIGATLFAAMFIVLFDILAVTALGERLFQEMIFPAFTILKLSRIADFLENLDALGALYFMCTAFIKLSVHLLTAVLCIRELLQTKSYTPVIWTCAAASSLWP
ncbi:GerAB/ArcD/ProY family transporter [Paenibacillus hexagrammi]|uniref:Spore germination protein n=1 Tax=Paenibacillus hexagrammi TaxID=2908839 RepID=A0ABY3SHZ5_9BACL|nr:endospore germination permease [Paenibacillus sp. YPD9-1]UJF33527.1 spore germination protein [Paenibacillus sp. YPD9-1]